MNYTAKTERSIIVTLLVILTFQILAFGSYSDIGLLYFHIIIAIFLLLAFFVNYKLIIEEGCLIYEIFIFTLPLYKKVVFPNQISKILFKRTGWARKSSIIKVEKGFNIRIVLFPDGVFADLIDFAEKNEIVIVKTRDYLILK